MRVGVVGEEEAGQLEQRHVERALAPRNAVYAKPTLDDDFDVAQTVADDCRGERQRHQAERNGGQLQRQRRIDAEGPGHRVAERERADAERRAPRDPAELTATGERRDLAEAASQHRDGGHGADQQVHRFEPIEPVQRAREQLAVRARARQRRCGSRQEAGRRIHGRQQQVRSCQTTPPVRPLWNKERS